MATREGELEKLGRAIRTEKAEGDVIETEVLGAWQDVGVGLDPCNQLTEDDTKAEDVAPLIVPFASQALRTHPVGRADRG